ncbi:phosphatase 2C 60 [Spatholobus suberectus]|nr:phosphatase 2C 60 [Spatholobus suberectus]
MEGLRHPNLSMITYFTTSRVGKRGRLVKAALQEAAKKREMRYPYLKKIDPGVRRHFHDDITVIVVYLDSNIVSRASTF